MLALASMVMGLPAAFAAAKKSTAKPEATAEATSPKSSTKPIPMYSRADSIDARAKTFTMKRKDGVEVRHVVTAQTEIRNGDADAKFTDIKVGDYVSGLRLKKGDAEYEVVKITKFGPKTEAEAKKAPGPKAK